MGMQPILSITVPIKNIKPVNALVTVTESLGVNGPLISQVNLLHIIPLTFQKKKTFNEHTLLNSYR